ncbi:hypothetical protein SORBI_3005G221675 [Sorghum bicolor]|uniref:Uncharacterized protein n=2 Tax=Sorghum bicolor TaxID=4558 RepID=A0A1Z5RK66_SORBI|nr:hypothetical protein SORBI_3005G221675 [Sorghum bicolor]
MQSCCDVASPPHLPAMLTTMAQGPSTTGEHHAGAAARSSLPLASLTQGPWCPRPLPWRRRTSSFTARAAALVRLRSHRQRGH